MHQVRMVKSFSTLMEVCLHAIGLWPNPRCAILSKLIWLTIMGTGQYFQYWYIFANYASADLSDFVESLSTSLMYSLTFLKFFTVWFKRRVFHDIFFALADDWNDFTLTDTEGSLMLSTAEYSQRCFKYIVTGYWACGCLYVVDTLVSWWVKDERKFILHIEFPVDNMVSPIYEFVLIGQFSQQLMLVGTEGILNALLLTLVFHAGCQIDIIRRRLANMPSKHSKVREATLKVLVNRHNRIITFLTSIKDGYSYIALMNFIVAIVILCLIGFVVVISLDASKGPMMIMKFLVFYVGVNIMAFIPCLAGEYVSAKSKSIGSAAYESVWYDMEPNEGRTLLLLILRAQRPLTITAGKFVDLSMECFLTMLKASASYMSVMHAMY